MDSHRELSVISKPRATKHFRTNYERYILKNVTLTNVERIRLAATAQTLAYGGSQPVPFQQGICKSQALGYGFTSSIARDAAQAVVDYVGCNATSFDEPETVGCLRSLDMTTLLNAELATVRGDLGYQWLPSVDGDFWPAAPSELLREGRFANVTTMIGWTMDDLTLYTDPTIATAQDTYDSVKVGYPGMSADNIDKLLALYPVIDFTANPAANKSNEFYRAARISRDTFMVCQPMAIASTYATAGNDVFLYEWNQTVVGSALASVRGLYGIGIPHTSEFAYTFGNISVYDVNGYPFEPTPADYALQHRGSRSWSTFASTGKPSLEGHDTLAGWEKAYPGDDTEPYVFVVGGPHEGLSALDGPKSTPEVEEQKLRERCAFINSPEVIEQLYF
ncbi:Secreted lipase [Lachnellula suecica]|uniref:Secreted lipase n=1 Tax=Lachnellula suecica TaxID=602035 RepID=A0A8T9CEZ4_9HELO|nr:Secreted lipase [Lachnellula suecica]